MYDRLGKAAVRFAIATCAAATGARSGSVPASPRPWSAIAAYLRQPQRARGLTAPARTYSADTDCVRRFIGQLVSRESLTNVR